jgi:hypothetical protein
VLSSFCHTNWPEARDDPENAGPFEPVNGLPHFLVRLGDLFCQPSRKWARPNAPLSAVSWSMRPLRALRLAAV